jgi:hypothetical protein
VAEPDLLSVGMNRKLARDVGIFNLPWGKTCPNATPFCSHYCYARKAEDLYLNSRISRARNLQASLKSNFVPRMVREIRDRGISRVRIHESGDFYNQKYLWKWLDIAWVLPKVKFWVYTRSFHLRFSTKPKNLTLFWSVDPGTNLAAVPPGRRAYVVPRGECIPKGGMTCVHTSPRHYCGSECKLCLTSKRDVYFPQH